jgi:hypothetical protein
MTRLCAQDLWGTFEPRTHLPMWARAPLDAFGPMQAWGLFEPTGSICVKFEQFISNMISSKKNELCALSLQLEIISLICSEDCTLLGFAPNDLSRICCPIALKPSGHRFASFLHADAASPDARLNTKVPNRFGRVQGSQGPGI